ncbi:MAG: cytochrome P450 [Acidimicrobiia bacterium]
MTTTELRWDPYNAEQRIDPYATWKRLRDEAPVYHNEQFGFYAISRYKDVYEASLDTETFSSTGGTAIDMIGEPLDPIMASLMIHMDPPKHDGFRKLVSRAYTPKRVSDLEGRMRELCGEYLDPFVGSGGFDYVKEFTMKLPVMVISTLLGFPREDHDMLREWSDLTLYREEGKAGLPEISQKAQAESAGYILGVIADRRANPVDDMITDLCETELTEPDGTKRKLTDLEVLGMISLISAAGNETVARLLGWASVVLAEHPDQRAELVADPKLIGAAVEELLRYEAPSPTQGRVTLKPATLHGVTIPPGSPVALLTGSAGRDERQYENPDRYEIHRKAEKHVSLGYGVHYCLGAALARLEGRIGIEETLKRFPEWHVDRSQIKYVETNTVRGPSSSPITF